MVTLSPTGYLQHFLDPISHDIDKFGGPHVLVGVIASGGQPHMYLIGNVKDTLKAEIYEALADRLRKEASELKQFRPTIIRP